MVKKKIIMPTVADVKEFVTAMNSCPVNAEIKTERYTVDAKSLMGIFSLDLSNPVELRLDCESDQAETIVKSIEKFIIE